MKQRNSSIELLRIISIFFIILMHVSSLIDYNEASHINKMWLCAINAIGNSGVSCFILISGYYGVRFSKEKFWYLVVLTIIYTLIVSLLNNGVDVKKTSEAILGLPLYNVDLWFVVCYLALMLISPYINEMIEVLSEYNYRKMLVILCFLLSVVPTLFYFPSVNGVMLTQGGKCFSYFLFVYLIGRYIRLHKDINLKEIKRIKMAWGGVLSTFIVTFVLIRVSSYLVNKRFFIYSYDSSVTILIQSILIFLIAKSYVFHCSFINIIAKSVFAFYILNYAYVFVDRSFIHVDNMSNEWYYIFAVLLESFIMVTSAFFIDQLIGKGVRIVLRRFCAKRST